VTRQSTKGFEIQPNGRNPVFFPFPPKSVGAYAVEDQAPVRIANSAGHQKRPAVAKLLQRLGTSTFTGQLADVTDLNGISESGFEVGSKVNFVEPHKDSPFLSAAELLVVMLIRILRKKDYL
jgi:hypothetical protein